MNIVVSDCSPLQALFHLDLLAGLRTVGLDVHVPEAVWAELVHPKSRRTPIPESALSMLTLHRVSNRPAVEALLETLDAGESEAIVLAEEMGCSTLLVDELLGRHEAKRRGLNVVGVVGVLRMMKAARVVEAVRPLLLKLRDQHEFWISQTLIETSDLDS